MKKTMLMGIREIPEIDNGKVKIEYYFMKEYRSRDEKIPLCGIRVVKCMEEDGHPSKEVETVPAISYSEEFVKRILQVMMRNLVTPVHVMEIVDDMVSREEEYYKGYQSIRA